MRIKGILTISFFITYILTISLLSSGGCDFSFGGGGGDGGNLQSIVQGTITSQPNSGITVQLINTDNQTIFVSIPNPTDDSGNFFIQGDFNGCLTLRLEFLDSNQTVLAFTSVTVFPKANVDLGNVSLDNGIVTLEDANDVSVTFEANINKDLDVPSTCTGGINNSQGTLVVTKGNTDITVQINTSTDIVDKNNNSIGCDNLFNGNTFQITGTLQVNDTVLATLMRGQ
jgi:hypothetical protein